MKKEEQQLLYCLRAYRKGEKTAPVAGVLSSEQWRGLHELSRVHKLTPVVFETLWNTPGFCGEDQSLLAAWKREAILQSVGQARRTGTLLAVTGEFDRAGISYAVVKGAVCRSLYRSPDLRPSGDEDLLIFERDRERSREVLKSCGLAASSQLQEDDVEHWMDPQSGLHIELHTRCFSTGWEAEAVLNPYFERCLQRTVPVSLERGTVQTLEPTAHLLFLIAHALKHFITGGFGVRTLSDILSFCERYENQIDQEHLWSMLEQIRGAEFFRALLAIGQTWLGFSEASWGCVSPECAEETDLLTDMLQAGVYGQTSMNRKHSAALSLQTAQGTHEAPSAWAALFPPAGKLVGRYPILRKAPALLPAVWIHRGAVYLLELLQGKGRENSPSETLSLAKKRTEMMVRYGILPQGKTEDR